MEQDIKKTLYVYAIQAMTTRYIKVGKTDRIDRRILELATGCPHELEYLGRWKADKTTETELHKHLDRYFHRGEWFELEPEVAVYEISRYLQSEPYTDREVEMQARLDLIEADSGQVVGFQSEKIRTLEQEIRKYQSIFLETQEAACANEKTLIETLDENEALKSQIETLDSERISSNARLERLAQQVVEKSAQIEELEIRLGSLTTPEPSSLQRWRTRASLMLLFTL